MEVLKTHDIIGIRMPNIDWLARQAMSGFPLGANTNVFVMLKYQLNVHDFIILDII